MTNAPPDKDPTLGGGRLVRLLRELRIRFWESRLPGPRAVAILATAAALIGLLLVMTRMAYGGGAPGASTTYLTPIMSTGLIALISYAAAFAVQFVPRTHIPDPEGVHASLLLTLNALVIVGLIIFLLAKVIPVGDGDSLLDLMFEQLSDWLPSYPVRVEFLSAAILSAVGVSLIGCIAASNFGRMEILGPGSWIAMGFYAFVGTVVLFAFVLNRDLSEVIDHLVTGAIKRMTG